MGRIKRGLDYFPMSTSFMHDRMVRRIMRREGVLPLPHWWKRCRTSMPGKGIISLSVTNFTRSLWTAFTVRNWMM